MDFGRPLPQQLLYQCLYPQSRSQDKQYLTYHQQKLQHLLEQSMHLCPVSNINAPTIPSSRLVIWLSFITFGLVCQSLLRD